AAASPNAVRTMTIDVGNRSRTTRNKSIPDAPGIRRSVSTRSNGPSSPRRFSASAPTSRPPLGSARVRGPPSGGERRLRRRRPARCEDEYPRFLFLPDVSALRLQCEQEPPRRSRLARHVLEIAAHRARQPTTDREPETGAARRAFGGAERLEQ